MNTSPTTNNAVSGLPAWTRFPRRNEREPLTGASRATLYRWREAGMITVKHVRRPGQIRGAAFIDVASLMRCIEGGDSTPAPVHGAGPAIPIPGAPRNIEDSPDLVARSATAKGVGA